MVHALAPMSTYRAAQLNTDESGNQLWSYWSKPFTFNERICNAGTTEQTNVKNIRIDLLIPLVIFVLCFLFALGVIIYQRRLILNNNKQPDHNYETPGQAQQKLKSNLERSKKNGRANNAALEGLYVNDDGACESFESSDHAIKTVERNEAESRPKISTGQESSTYMSLKDSREPENAYQSLQQPNIQTVEYENPAFISYKNKKSAK